MRRDYKTAAYLFEACASSNTNTVGSCLFAGHSYAYAGNRDKAIAMYRRVCEIAPGSNEAKVAEGYLAKLGAPEVAAETRRSAAKRVAEHTKLQGTTSGTAASKQAQPETKVQRAIAAAKKKPLLDRIVVVPPRMGHPPVDQRTINTVKFTIRGLPETVFKILEEAGVTIYVAPNAMDVWPDAVNARHAVDDHYFTQEPGRTFDQEREIYVYERPVVTPGDTYLGDMRSTSEIRVATQMQCAHAVDYCLEHLSNDSRYRKLWKMDVDAMDYAMKDKLKLYVAGGDVGPAETFGEVMMLIMGADTIISSDIKHAFPRTSMWVESFLKKTVHDRF